MDQMTPTPARIRGPRSRQPLAFRGLLEALLSEATREDSTAAVLDRICTTLLRYSGCDAASVQLEAEGYTTRCRKDLSRDSSELIEGAARRGMAEGATPRVGSAGALIPEEMLEAVLSKGVAAPAQSCTRNGSFWTGDTARPILLRAAGEEGPATRTIVIGGEFQSVAVIPIQVSHRSRGVLCLACRRRDGFSSEDIQGFETVAQTLGIALAHRGAQWALGERVKELTCLYEIARLAERPGASLEDLLGGIAALLPPAWQYPAITTARIVLDGRSYSTAGFSEGRDCQSAAIIVNERPRGIVEVFYTGPAREADEGPFLKEERNLINAVADTVGKFVAHREAEWALRERVKELTCLYGIAKVAARPGISPDRILAEIVDLLPPGWQYPDITQARITLDRREVSTPGFGPGPDRQSAEIQVRNVARGFVEVLYTGRMPEMDEGPFLKEERSLINEVARQIGVIVDRWEAEQEQLRLQEQLRHAERLATIGQLSAGVAHELNEPLGAALGFSELVRQSPALPAPLAPDVDRIIKAALLAREIIRKLMIFTRQMPIRRVPCDLNHIVGDGLFFLESRCEKEGIVLRKALAEGLPLVMADPAQLQQVVVNLVVNAIQAMPDGGTLTVTTRCAPPGVALVVTDTGTGMSADVQARLFTPFFTTKDVGQGTGLGLAVVHGIVTGHAGSLHVQSEVGRGSSFEVRIPATAESRSTKERSDE